MVPKRVDRVVACLHGRPGGLTAPGALSVSAGSPRVASAAFNAVAYKECSPTNGAECWRSLEIQSWPECRRNASSYPRDPRDVTLDGEEQVSTYGSLPAMSFDSGSRVELYDGTTTVVIFAADRTSAQRAALALIHANSSSLGRPPVDARAAADDATLACKGGLSGGLEPPLGVARQGATQAPLQTAFTHNEAPKGACARSFVDPINVFWYGRSTSARAVGRELGVRGGWWMDDDAPLIATVADHQDAQAPSPECTREADQRASSCPICDRDHTVCSKPPRSENASFSAMPITTRG